jgi:hypothetical protein
MKSIYFDYVGSEVTLLLLMALLNNKQHLAGSVVEDLQRTENFLKGFREILQIAVNLEGSFKLVFSVDIENIVPHKTGNDLTISILVKFSD